MYKGVCYFNGSNFTIDRLSASSPLTCGRGGKNSIQGEVIVCDDANCSTCNNTTKPIQCSHNHNGSTISLLRPSNSSSYSGSNMMYKCCLPYSCNDSDTSIIKVNIQGKYVWIL